MFLMEILVVGSSSADAIQPYHSTSLPLLFRHFSLFFLFFHLLSFFSILTLSFRVLTLCTYKVKHPAVALKGTSRTPRNRKLATKRGEEKKVVTPSADPRRRRFDVGARTGQDFVEARVASATFRVEREDGF